MKNNDSQYDIFISYRRSDGFSTARLIYDRLEQMGYCVSFDLETLRSGNFNTQIYERIEKCRDVIVIVSHDALKFRDDPEHDWLRLEVAHALKHNKNIIPVFLREVVVPQKGDMPEDIAELVMKNGVTASEEHFDSVINKILRMLHSRRSMKRKFLFGAIFLVIAALAGAGFWYFYQNPIYPLTHREKQEFSLIFNYLAQQMEAVNLASHYHKRLLDAAENAVLTGNTEEFKDEKASFENSLRNLKIAKFDSDLVVMAERSKVIDAGDLKMFPDTFDSCINYILRSSDDMERLLSYSGVVSKSDQRNIIRIDREYGNILSEGVGLSFIALLYKVKSPVLDDFKKIIAPQLTSLPVLSSVWPASESDIIKQMNFGNEKLKTLLQEKSMILGNLTQGKNFQEDQLRKQLKKSGLTDEQIARHLKKRNEISRKKAELAEMQIRLKEIRQKARVKFAPSLSDSDGILWGKMICLKKSSLPEDALKVLDFIKKNSDKTISDEVCRVAELVLKSPQTLPFVHGMVVGFFEAPATVHGIFHPGDVIVKVNDKDCHAYKDFRTAEGVRYTIYRLKKDKFEKHDLVMPANQPKTAIAELPF
ncbi:MAG: toll/interleukin-1 receptor domain-containing protein [Lentisphaeria bacterium]|nr:toll/interleukin-1 receptor domain-containing protein [Lentisphaeria bacterium]